MTTLIGIKVEKGELGVILASDLSRTQTEWKPQGDVAYRQQTKSEGQKIHVDDKGEIAVCMSGVFDQPYVDFLSALLEGDINVKKAIKKGCFQELLQLNLARWCGKTPDQNYINGLLLATRFKGQPKLYTCFPLGKIEERYWTSLGSGSGYALEHIAKQDKLIPRRLSLNDGIGLIVDALDESSQDIHTCGLDLIVVNKDKIVEYGETVKTAITDARTKAIKDIKAQYSGKPRTARKK